MRSNSCPSVNRRPYVLSLRLPDPMFARPGLCPPAQGGPSSSEWDGFRAIVSTEDGLRVRSRRGWNMTPVLCPSCAGVC
jgi:hypothetical protein